MAEVWYWSPLSEDDQTGAGWITGLTCLILVIMTTATRLFLRKGMLGFEDGLIGASLVLYLGQNAAVFFALKHGFGKFEDALDESQRSKIGQALYVSTIFAVCAHHLAKLSLAWLVRRLFFSHALLDSWACNALIAGIGVSWITSATLAAIGRFPIGMLQGSADHAAAIVHQWAAVTGLDIVTEAALAGIPVFLVLTILKKGKQKFLVTFVFLVRLPLCAFSVAHLFHVRAAVHNVHDIVFPLLASSGALELELAWSLISASVPSLKSLVQPFNEIKEVVNEKVGDVDRPQGGFFYRDG